MSDDRRSRCGSKVAQCGHQTGTPPRDDITLSESYSAPDGVRIVAPPQDVDEIETAFETVREGIFHRTIGNDDADVPADKALDALATIHRTMEGLRAENVRLLKQMNDVADDKGKAEAERDEAREMRVTWQRRAQLGRASEIAAKTVRNIAERDLREATSRAEQAEAERDRAVEAQGRLFTRVGVLYELWEAEGWDSLTLAAREDERLEALGYPPTKRRDIVARRAALTPPQDTERETP
jgi:hypothetical protein